MKRFRFLSVSLVITAAVFLWPRKPAPEKPSAPAPGAPTSRGVVLLQSSERPTLRENGEVELVSSNATDKLLASIRAKLARLNETPKADKGGEDELMTDLLGVLTDDNAAEVTRALTPEELNSRFGLAALQRWLDVDVFAAADWIATRPNATDEQAWSVANRMAGDDALVESYRARLADTPWTQLFLKQAVFGSTWRNPEGALRLVQQMKPSDAQRDLLQATACSWVISNPEPASDWIARVPDAALREELVCAAAKTHAAVDPVASISWLIACVPHPSEGGESLAEQTVRDVFGTWAESNPAQAAEATAQLPAGNFRDETVSLVTRGWLQRDPAAAVAWIKTLPERDRIQAMFRVE